MVPVTRSLQLDEHDISVHFIHASGPGGQHVNKVATAAQLHYNPNGRRPLPAHVFEKLRAIAGGRMSAEGTLVITARRHRSQEQNRADALARLVALVRAAAHRERPRVATRPSRASRARRLQRKKTRGTIKSLRGKVPTDED